MHLVYILFENFQASIFHYTTQVAGRKDTYTIQKIYKEPLPQFWKRDKKVQEQIVLEMLQDVYKQLQIESTDTTVVVVSDDSDISYIKFKGNVKTYILSQKDYSLVPYFASSYFTSLNASFVYLKYYSLYMFDNKGNEVYTKWNDWKEIGDAIVKNIHIKDKHLIDIWLNHLIRPIMYEDSFYLAAIAGLFMGSSHLTFSQYESAGVTVIAGGETFGWLRKKEDILFSFLVGIEASPSFMNIYADSENVLSINKPLKDLSLKNLERSTANFIKHVGNILTIKTKKKVKASTIIGKISIHDEEGYKTVYPVSDDLMKIHVVGKATVVLDLQSPFYISGDTMEYSVQDMLIIDTRMQDRNNIINFKSWYDRIK